MASLESQISELQKDLDEIALLEKQTTRLRLKNVLLMEKNKINSELNELKKSKMDVDTNIAASNKNIQIKITNYAWDQDTKFVKFYVTLKNVNKLPSENIIVECTPKSVKLLVKNLENKDYLFTINNLLKEIKANDFTVKMKTDMVVILCPKVESGYTWSHVTKIEKKAAEKTKKMDFDDDDDKSDPTSGLMKIMKKMYDQGDDDLKRTIAKAWTESQENKAKMDL